MLPAGETLQRKCLRGLDCKTFEDYAVTVSANLCGKHTALQLACGGICCIFLPPPDSTLKQRLLDCYAAQAPYFQFIEPFTASYSVGLSCGTVLAGEMTHTFTQALQVCLQGVMEALVLVDRWTFLMENKLSVDLVPVFDDTISPRNMALLVSRAQ